MAQDMAPATEDLERALPATMAVLSSSAFLIGASEALIWLTVRAVMTLGSTMTNGADEVAVPAPAWLWIVPLSIVGLIIGMRTSGNLAESHDTPSLMLLAWSTLFLSIGWNLAQFGLRAPGDAGFSLGLLVSGAAVSLTGAGGFYSFRAARKAKRELTRWQAEQSGARAIRPVWRSYQVANAIALVAGVAAGWGLFSLLGH